MILEPKSDLGLLTDTIHNPKEISVGLYRSGIFQSEVKRIHQTGFNKKSGWLQAQLVSGTQMMSQASFLALNFFLVALFLCSLWLHGSKMLACPCLISQQRHRERNTFVSSVYLAETPD